MRLKSPLFLSTQLELITSKVATMVLMTGPEERAIKDGNR